MYTFLATLIVSAMSLSQDGKLTLSCETVEGENAAEIKISTHTNKYLSKTVECYDDLIIPANPFTLELAALKDCAASNSFKLEAKQTDSELVLSLRFPGKLEQNGVLRAQDIDNSDRKYFVSLLYELFDMLPAKN